MGKDVTLNELDFIIKSHLSSDKLKNMIKGEKYYKGEHDILGRKKYGIGKKGEKVELIHVANNKIVDNKYAAILNQKINYLLSKTPTISSKNSEYAEIVTKILGKKFLKILFGLGRDAYNYGISWLYVYYDNGVLSFKKFDATEIIPIWEDKEHTRLDKCIRLFTKKKFIKNKYVDEINVELYTKNGIEYFIWQDRLIPKNEKVSYFKLGDQAFNWDMLPIIPFKANDFELTLLSKCKSIQDAINELTSDAKNDMEDNGRNSILVIKGYTSKEPGTLRHNINQYGYIGVNNDGGVEELNIEVNAQNYEIVLRLMKLVMFENANGVDSKSEILGSNPNQMNIQSMYSSIDLDANELEREFQTSLDMLLWFINQHLLFFENKDFTNEDIDIIFNRDILINESQAIEDCLKSLGILSKETVISQHPWVGNVKVELLKIEKENQAEYIIEEL